MCRNSRCSLFQILRLNPENPEGADRDRLVFSKAHDGKVLFSVLCRRGFFDEEVLKGTNRMTVCFLVIQHVIVSLE